MPRKRTEESRSATIAKRETTQQNAGERRNRERQIDWDLEGSAPPDSYGHGTRGYDDDTDRGYDEAAHRGNAYGVPAGLGGAFGTSGGGSYSGGFQVVNRAGSPRGDWERGREIEGYEGARGGTWERGPNAGRGPRGYKRADERILDDVHDCLERDGWVDATEIEITVDDGDVALHGTVETRQMRRRAEDLVDSISGVKHVTNDLRVRRR
jgi:osmotically-inducible protein OsmY